MLLYMYSGDAPHASTCSSSLPSPFLEANNPRRPVNGYTSLPIAPKRLARIRLKLVWESLVASFNSSIDVIPIQQTITIFDQKIQKSLLNLKIVF